MIIVIIVKLKKTKLKRTTFFHITPPSLTNLFITASHICYDFNTHIRYWHVEGVACATVCAMYCMICYNVVSSPLCRAVSGGGSVLLCHWGNYWKTIPPPPPLSWPASSGGRITTTDAAGPDT